jgi:hypothetical protein
LSLRLKSIGGSTLAVTLLAAVMLALFPAVAEAQTEDNGTPAIVVRPGDSLWSISEQLLGPNATPQRIANAAERIHELNRAQIGADPDLILVGQELLVPPALSERTTGAPPAPKTTEAAEAGPRDRAAQGTASNAQKPAPTTTQRTAAGGADVEGAGASKTEAQPVSLPVLPDAAASPVPAVGMVAPDGSPTSPVASLLRKIRAEVASVPTALAETFADAGTEGRRMLGLGIVLLTLVAAVLIAWKLPMRRTTRRDAERWGTPAGHHGYHRGAPATRRAVPFAYHSGSLGGADASPAREGGLRVPEEAPGHKRGTLRRAPDAQTLRSRAEAYILRPESREEASPGNCEATNGDASATSGIRKAAAGGRGRAPKAKKIKAVARNGLALGAHNPAVRRAPLRARASMRARRLRPRLGHGRGVSARGGR